KARSCKYSLAAEVDAHRLIKPNHVLWWRSHDGIRILDLRSKTRFRLAGTSAHIWDNLLQRCSRDDIVAALAEVYDAEPEQLYADVDDLLRDLVRQELLLQT
ncbi:MAG: PqqD family protein, partial [Deltaproteobacteria bacterium]|nr:PqqD family protein [Deltaproteobacteria bacterium]